MSPEIKGRVLVVEDSELFFDIEELLIKEKGYEVLWANNLQDALEICKKLKELGVTKVVVDGNLSSKSRDGADGRQIIAVIREVDPTIVIIGMSAEVGLEDVDVELGKEKVVQLLDIL